MNFSVDVLRPSIGAIVIALVSVAPKAAGADLPPADPFAAVRAPLLAARHELGSYYADVQRRSGMASDLQSRLDGDVGALSTLATPPSWTVAEYLVGDGYFVFAAAFNWFTETGSPVFPHAPRM